MGYYQRIQIIFLLALFFYGCNQYKEKRVSNLVKEANQVQDTDQGRALEYLNEALSIDSNCISAHILKGEILKFSGHDSAALMEFSKARRLDPQNTRALFDLGNAWSLLDRDDSAIIFYNKAIETKGSDSIYIDLPDPGLPIDYFNSDISMPVIRYFRGLSYYLTNQYHSALLDFTFSLNNKYKIKDCYLYLGLIYLEFDIHDKGCENLTHALENGNMDAKKYLDQYCKK